MRVAEIYRSVQGEGLWTGTDSVFVRAAGCNLRCWYCDTPYASWQPEGDDLAVPEIVERACQFACPDVVLTGGEPMLFSELIPLCDELRRRGLRITIETAGTLYLPLTCDLMSISPKRANSTPTVEAAPRWRDRHEQARHAPDVIRRLIAEHPYQIKFVVGTEADCDDVFCYLDEFPEVDRGRVLLMPLGTDASRLVEIGRWLEPLCQRGGVKYCPRRHIEWFGLRRGT